jgi:hypothetical protein
VIEAPAILQQALTLPARKSIRAPARWPASGVAAAGKIAEAALAMFRNEDFHYTLRPPLLGANAIDEFLFDTAAASASTTRRPSSS